MPVVGSHPVCGDLFSSPRKLTQWLRDRDTRSVEHRMQSQVLECGTRSMFPNERTA